MQNIFDSVENFKNIIYSLKYFIINNKTAWFSFVLLFYSIVWKLAVSYLYSLLNYVAIVVNRFHGTTHKKKENNFCFFNYFHWFSFCMFSLSIHKYPFSPKIIACLLWSCDVNNLKSVTFSRRISNIAIFYWRKLYIA